MLYRSRSHITSLVQNLMLMMVTTVHYVLFVWLALSGLS